MKTFPLTEHFGVELHGLSLLSPLDAEELQGLRDAFDSQGVIIIRGQKLRDENHDRFVEDLGVLHTFPWGTTVEYLSNVLANNPSITGSRRLLFHTDGAYRSEVPSGTCLYAQSVSATSSPTAFANSVRAYDNLSPDLKTQIANLHGCNTFDSTGAKTDADPARLRIGDCPGGRIPEHVIAQVHPVVISVPHTGHKALFVNEFNTSHIVEYGPESQEGEQLLQILFSSLYAPTNVYTHHYREHDVVLWNNLAVQHARTIRVDHNPRTLRRLVIDSLHW